jgi:hypothetical protein
MTPGMLNSEMIEDTGKIVNEAIKDLSRSNSSSITGRLLSALGFCFKLSGRIEKMIAITDYLVYFG